MDMLRIPYGFDNPTASGVLGFIKLRDTTMIYSANASS